MDWHRDIWDGEADNIFNKIQKEINLKREREQPTKACGNDNHLYCGSIYPKECVPLSLFINPYNDSHYIHCLDCRTYRKNLSSYPANKKIAKSPDEHGVFSCIKCKSMRTAEFCEKCTQRRDADRKRRTKDYKLVLWEKNS